MDTTWYDALDTEAQNALEKPFLFRNEFDPNYTRSLDEAIGDIFLGDEKGRYRNDFLQFYKQTAVQQVYDAQARNILKRLESAPETRFCILPYEELRNCFSRIKDRLVERVEYATKGIQQHNTLPAPVYPQGSTKIHPAFPTEILISSMRTESFKDIDRVTAIARGEMHNRRSKMENDLIMSTRKSEIWYTTKATLAGNMGDDLPMKDFYDAPSQLRLFWGDFDREVIKLAEMKLNLAQQEDIAEQENKLTSCHELFPSGNQMQAQVTLRPFVQNAINQVNSFVERELQQQLTDINALGKGEMQRLLREEIEATLENFRQLRQQRRAKS